MSTRGAETFAKYHDEQASYGGVSWEFHARASTFIRDQDAAIRALSEALQLIKKNRAHLLHEEREAMESALAKAEALP